MEIRYDDDGVREVLCRLAMVDLATRNLRKLQDQLDLQSLPVAKLYEIIVKQAYQCVYCPSRIIHTFSLDHIVAIRNGGKHELSNIQFICKHCNMSKGDRDRPKSLPFRWQMYRDEDLYTHYETEADIFPDKRW